MVHRKTITKKIKDPEVGKRRKKGRGRERGREGKREGKGEKERAKRGNKRVKGWRKMK